MALLWKLSPPNNGRAQPSSHHRPCFYYCYCYRHIPFFLLFIQFISAEETRTLLSFAFDFDTLEHLAVSQLTVTMPSATGESWEKYKKNFADEEEPEKKITPLTDEYVLDCVALTMVVTLRTRC